MAHTRSIHRSHSSRTHIFWTNSATQLFPNRTGDGVLPEKCENKMLKLYRLLSVSLCHFRVKKRKWNLKPKMHWVTIGPRHTYTHTHTLCLVRFSAHKFPTLNSNASCGHTIDWPAEEREKKKSVNSVSAASVARWFLFITVLPLKHLSRWSLDNHVSIFIYGYSSNSFRSDSLIFLPLLLTRVCAFFFFFFSFCLRSHSVLITHTHSLTHSHSITVLF